VIESSPRLGDIGLAPIVGPVGWLIRVGQRLNRSKRNASRYQHAFIVTSDSELIEARPGGACIRPLSDYPDAVFVCPDGLTDAQRDAICAAARRYLGTGYSAVEYFALAAHRFRLPIPGLRRYVASSHRMICSQLVDRCYQDAGVQLFADGRWDGWVTPADLDELLGQGGERR
jgi:hypothetical protein